MHQSRLQQSNSASAVLHSRLIVFSRLETAAWLLQGSFRAGDHSTLSNLSVHTSIELVLNLFLSVLCSGRFVLFNSKFTLRRDQAALSPTETILWFVCASGPSGMFHFPTKVNHICRLFNIHLILSHTNNKSKKKKESEILHL